MRIMNRKNTFRLLYVINRSKVNKEGCPILLRITINGERVAVNTKRRIFEKDWNKSTGLPNQTSEMLFDLCLYLESFRNKAFKAYSELSSDYDIVSPQMVRDHIQGKNYGTEKFIIQEWDLHNSELKLAIGKTCSHTLWRKHCRARTLFSEFIQNKFRSNDLPMKNIDFHVVKGFQQFLLVSKDFQYNTSIKTLQFLKKITNHALKNNWLRKDPFDGIKLSLKQTERPYLTDDELLRIRQKKLSIPRIDLVRDLFVFSCYTGLAYADVKKLKRCELEQTSDGMWWIKTWRTKTDQKSQIPLLDVAKKILEKYADLETLSAQDKLLPVMSNQKLNSYLKEVGDMCQITKNLTFHVARHTFATTVTLQNGVSIESVSRMMGHSNIQTTQHYARIVDKKIAMDMLSMSQKTSLKMAQ